MAHTKIQLKLPQCSRREAAFARKHTPKGPEPLAKRNAAKPKHKPYVANTPKAVVREYVYDEVTTLYGDATLPVCIDDMLKFVSIVYRVKLTPFQEALLRELALQRKSPGAS